MNKNDSATYFDSVLNIHTRIPPRGKDRTKVIFNGRNWLNRASENYEFRWEDTWMNDVAKECLYFNHVQPLIDQLCESLGIRLFEIDDDT